jgi:hypothetical protein
MYADGVADEGRLESDEAYAPVPSAPASEVARWAGGDAYDAVVDLDQEEDSSDRGEQSGAAATSSADHRRSSRDDMDLDRSVSRSAEKAKKGSDRSKQDAGTRAVTEAPAEVADADKSRDGAGAAPTDTLAKDDDRRTGSAEWTLQTTDPGIAYRVSGLCGGAVYCTWTSPSNTPGSLDAQDNYQIVRVEVPLSGYETIKGGLRGLGDLLVRSEDVALMMSGDSVVITVVLEYLP